MLGKKKDQFPRDLFLPLYSKVRQPVERNTKGKLSARIRAIQQGTTI
jgi:hypothetical protein